MSEHNVKIVWKSESGVFDFDNYNRDHEWHFEGGAVIEASAAPAYSGNESLTDPEEAFVASISSCHMLTFLAICAKKKFPVREYTDNAVGYQEKDETGSLAITRVLLKPRVEFENAPSEEELAGIHESAHKYCFIANSVKTDIKIEHVTD